MVYDKPLHGKNPIHTDGVHHITVEVPIISADHRQFISHFTASLQDYDIIKEHRWRILGGEVVTLIDTKTTPLTTLILHIPTGTVPHQTDGNQLNFSRENLRLGAKVKQNEVLVNEDYAYITLPDTKLAIVDALDADKVSPYFWKVYTVRGRDVVRTQYKEGKVWKKVDLSRFILSYHGKKSVVNINGDALDNRRDNLTITND